MLNGYENNSFAAEEWMYFLKIDLLGLIFLWLIQPHEKQGGGADYIHV